MALSYRNSEMLICPANEWTGFYDKEFCHEREKGEVYARHQTVWLGNVDKDWEYSV